MKNISIVLLLGVAFLLTPVSVQAAKKDGIHLTHYDTGEVRYKSTYKDGKLNGLTLEYAKDGTKITKYVFKDDKAVRKIVLTDTRNYGPFAFLVSFKFWLILGVSLALIWLLFAKTMFSKRPL